ncbi:hypothetical protein BDZ97DRAFT_463618 [Flammula alnicola]|nr:hypothetical protein BDZ97DRAFT_463618 [Flammula alnicola]
MGIINHPSKLRHRLLYHRTLLPLPIRMHSPPSAFPSYSTREAKQELVESPISELSASRPAFIKSYPLPTPQGYSPSINDIIWLWSVLSRLSVPILACNPILVEPHMKMERSAKPLHLIRLPSGSTPQAQLPSSRSRDPSQISNLLLSPILRRRGLGPSMHPRLLPPLLQRQ